MKFRTKVAIFLVAVLLTFVGFNAIAFSSAVDLMKVGKRAGYNLITNVLAEEAAAAHRAASIKG